jgi:hypothetical protein
MEGHTMWSVVSGVVVMGLGLGGFWYLRPQNGVVRPIMVKPVYDYMIPIGLLGIIAIGIAMIFTGLVE